MSLILVKDNDNSKVRELECTSAGLLKVDHVDVSALATQATLSSIDGHITACNTGAVVVSSSALPAGACTESTLSSLNGKVTACDTGSISGTVAVSAVSGNVACTHASLPLPSGASSESTLSALNSKVSACDTSALATSSLQTAGNSSLADLAGCVSANKVSVSSVPATLSATHLYFWGDASAGESVSNATDQFSDSVDVDAISKLALYGSSSNFGDEFEVQLSHNDSNWFELTSAFVQVDYASGEFGFTSDASFKYIRLKKKSSGGSGTDTVWAILSAK